MGIYIKSNETDNFSVGGGFAFTELAEYTGDILLVGISYDRETKAHTCQIERWEKE